MIQGIIQRVIDDTTFANLVGEDGQGYVKFYPVVAPEKVKRPYVTARIVNSKPDGCQVSTKDIEFFEVYIFSEEYKEGYDIEDAVRRSIEGFKGTSAGIEFTSIAFLSHEDAFDDMDDSFIKVSRFQAQVKR